MGRSGLCNICGDGFKLLKQHMKDVHETSFLQFHCEFCNKMFPKERSMRNQSIPVQSALRSIKLKRTWIVM